MRKNGKLRTFRFKSDWHMMRYDLKKMSREEATYEVETQFTDSIGQGQFKHLKTQFHHYVYPNQVRAEAKSFIVEHPDGTISQRKYLYMEDLELLVTNQSITVYVSTIEYKEVK